MTELNMKPCSVNTASDCLVDSVNVTVVMVMFWEEDF